jgi:methyltransferase-like protein/2-polyprenyl-3-methyl-5-hydroxy-6-metoxy-1,4-benzoquinol methylase
MTESSYDAVPYTSNSFEETSPESLAVVARVFGLESPDIHTCRVLELGCSSGGNILPLAELYPDAEFVGVDLSARQIEDGRACLAELGLKNARLEMMSVQDITPAFGQFDYIVAHGLYSWVDAAMQEHVLRVCKENLSPKGVAYVSYNTRPGWNMVQSIRDLMLYHTAKFSDPAMKTEQARAVVNFMLSGLEGNTTPHAQLMRDEMQLLTDAGDYYLYHDHLEVNNNPVYFHEFMTSARSAGLEYLGDTELQTMLVDNLPKPVADKLRTITDIVQVEQYMDFFRNRRFRHTLLIHGGLELNRNITTEALEKFYLTTDMVPVVPLADAELTDTSKQNFSCKRSNVATEHPLTKLVIQTLIDQGGLPRRIDEIAQAAAARAPQYSFETVKAHMLGDLNLAHFVFTGIVKLHLTPGAYSHTLPERPAISRMMAWQMQRSELVTNCRHESIRLNEVDKVILAEMDGSRTVPELVERMLEFVKQGRLRFNLESEGSLSEEHQRQNLKAVFERILGKFTKLAFFVR